MRRTSGEVRATPILPSALGRFGIEHVQTLSGSHASKRLVGGDEPVKQILSGEVECDRKLDRVQSPQTVREAVPPDQALSHGEMVLRHAIHFDVTSRDIEHEPCALHPGGSPIENAGTHFHRKRGLDFKEP